MCLRQKKTDYLNKKYFHIWQKIKQNEKLDNHSNYNKNKVQKEKS